MDIFSKTKLNAYWPLLTEAEIFKLLSNQTTKAPLNNPIIITFEQGKLTAKQVNFQYFFKRDYLVEVRQTVGDQTILKPYFAVFFTKDGNFYVVKCHRRRSEDGKLYQAIGGLKAEDAAEIATFLANYEETTLHRVSRESAYSFNTHRNIYY